MKFKVGPENINTLARGVIYSFGYLMKINLAAVALALIIYFLAYLNYSKVGEISKLNSNILSIFFILLFFLVLGNIYFISSIVSKLVYWYFEITPLGIAFYSKDKKLRLINFESIVFIRFMKNSKFDAYNSKDSTTKLLGYLHYKTGILTKMALIGPKNSSETELICSQIRQKLPDNKIFIESISDVHK